MTLHKYKYPDKFIKKNGKLKKTMRKQISNWRKDIKENYLNQDMYTKLKLENEKLKQDIIDYQDALEIWVLVAQNN
jgi:mRNA-degrading endonuclease RelE of RelBE toxin-antitoxin system